MVFLSSGDIPLVLASFFRGWEGWVVRLYQKRMTDVWVGSCDLVCSAYFSLDLSVLSPFCPLAAKVSEPATQGMERKKEGDINFASSRRGIDTVLTKIYDNTPPLCSLYLPFPCLAYMQAMFQGRGQGERGERRAHHVIYLDAFCTFCSHLTGGAVGVDRDLCKIA